MNSLLKKAASLLPKCYKKKHADKKERKSSKVFVRRLCVLQRSHLCYFRSRNDVGNREISINLRFVFFMSKWAIEICDSLSKVYTN